MTMAEAWEENARDWISWARTPLHDGFWEGTWPVLRAVMPEPCGPVLDLGCGEGRGARLLQSAGWQVLGVDRSGTLAQAAATGSPTVAAVQADAAVLPVADNSVGLVVACMSLMDVDDLDSAVAETVRVLRPGGAFCLAIVHPFDSALEQLKSESGTYRLPAPYLQARRYEDHFERDGLRMTFASMHRPLGTYCEALFRCGMIITELREHSDGDMPWLLVIRAEKPA
jgi:SAM-dependent methyltransferase